MNRYLLRKLIKKFNINRKPECFAKTRKNNEKFLLIEFSGSTASHSCCFDEYFNDFTYLFKDEIGLKLEIENIKKRDLNKFLVKYNILN